MRKRKPNYMTYDEIIVFSSASGLYALFRGFGGTSGALNYTAEDAPLAGSEQLQIRTVLSKEKLSQRGTAMANESSRGKYSVLPGSP